MPSLTDNDPGLGMTERYAVQREVIGLLDAAGDRITDYQVGTTSAPGEKLIGVNNPDHEPVLASTVCHDWLPNALGENGVALEPGQLTLTGALHAIVPMAAGDVFRAEFDRLGAMIVRAA
ncbi:hypothetical protein ACIRSS_05510 [Amycolatopsis sp. NPDC101161]|uniref:hypothetical protein n=1 Tax=Amycolatopsis sp. NPDC101161 TaxID=3363940 RepID=UPI0037FC6587